MLPKSSLRSLSSQCRLFFVHLKALSLLRKEVIQPHLPIRLPCYDFTPVIGLTFGSSLLAVESLTSGAPNSHGVTGGVYKACLLYTSILVLLDPKTNPSLEGFVNRVGFEIPARGHTVNERFPAIDQDVRIKEEKRCRTEALPMF